MNFIIIGLIIGWLVEWLIDWFYWRRRGKAHRQQLAAAQEKAAKSSAELADAQTWQTNAQREIKELKVQVAEAKQTRHQLDAQVAGNQRLYEKLADAEAQIKKLKSQLNHNSLAASPSQKKPESLEEIRGIGSRFAQRLNEAGVYTYADLAQLSPDRVRKIVAARAWHNIDPESWIAEAKLRAKKTTPATKGDRS